MLTLNQLPHFSLRLPFNRKRWNQPEYLHLNLRNLPRSGLLPFSRPLLRLPKLALPIRRHLRVSPSSSHPKAKPRTNPTTKAMSSRLPPGPPFHGPRSHPPSYPHTLALLHHRRSRARPMLHDPLQRFNPNHLPPNRPRTLHRPPPPASRLIRNPYPSSSR